MAIARLIWWCLGCCSAAARLSDHFFPLRYVSVALRADHLLFDGQYRVRIVQKGVMWVWESFMHSPLGF